MPLRSATERMGESLGTTTASSAGRGTVAPTYTRGAPAAWAKMGGASPTSPKSIEPTFSASNCTGPAVNSVQVTFTPSGARRFSSVPRPFKMDSQPFWWPMRSTRLPSCAQAARLAPKVPNVAALARPAAMRWRREEENFEAVMTNPIQGWVRVGKAAPTPRTRVLKNGGKRRESALSARSAYTLHRTWAKGTAGNCVAVPSTGRKASFTSTFTASSRRRAISGPTL